MSESGDSALITGVVTSPSIAPTAPEDPVQIDKKSLEPIISNVSQKIIDEKFTTALNKVLVWILTVVVAWTITEIIDLNRVIYEAVGKQSIEHKVSDLEEDRLKNKIQDLERELAYNQCMNDSKVTRKAGCYK